MVVDILKHTVFNWRDMEQFGIIHLTGEADALKLRALFDLTEAGRDLVTGFLNLPHDVKLRPNMNSVGVANIALPYSILKDLAVAGFVKAGYKTVIVHPEYVMALPLDASEDDIRDYLDANRDKVTVIRRPAA